jgi:cysteine desulfurase
VVHLPVDGDGRVRGQDLADLLERHHAGPRTTLVSVQWVNNETGVIQPVAELGDVCRAAGRTIRFHVDATQAVGKMPVDVGPLAVDLMSFAAHKFHGPKGVGALYVRRGVRLRPQLLGGPQEGQRRGGTENVPGIVGMGVAADLARDFLVDSNHVAGLGRLRDDFEQRVLGAWPNAVVNSRGGPRIWNTSNIAFPRLEAEAILIGLSERGVCASAGAACSSGSLEPSPVLLAMGIPEEAAHGSVRFSLSRQTTAWELQAAAGVVAQVVDKLAATVPLGR